MSRTKDRDADAFGRHQSRCSGEVQHFGRGCRVTEISTEAETRGERASERVASSRALEFSRRPFDLFELTFPSRLPPHSSSSAGRRKRGVIDRSCRG